MFTQKLGMRIMQKIAKSITAYFYASGVLKQDMIEICEYGAELVLAGITNVMMVLFTGILIHQVIYGIFFLMIMIPTRAFIGGYHAKTHLRCNISFVCTYLLSLLLLKIIDVRYEVIVQIFVIAGFIIISAWAPLENRNKKLSDIQKNLYNKISQVIYILLMVIGIVVNYKDQELSLYINIILIIVVALLIIGKEGRGENEEKDS